MRCRAILLKARGLTSKEVGVQTAMTPISVNSWVKRYETEGINGLETRPGRGRKLIPIINGLLRRGGRTHCHRERQAERDESERGMAAGFGQGGERESIQGFLSALVRDIDV